MQLCLMLEMIPGLISTEKSNLLFPFCKIVLLYIQLFCYKMLTNKCQRISRVAWVKIVYIFDTVKGMNMYVLPM